MSLKPYRIEILSIIFLVILTGLIGWMIGAIPQIFILPLVLWLGFYAYQLSALLGWINRDYQGRGPIEIGLFQQITQGILGRHVNQARSIQKISASVQHISQLTQAIEEGIVVLDEQLKLQWWNNAAAQQLGLDKKDKGLTITSLIRTPELEAYLSSKKIIGTLEILSRVNSSRWLQVQASKFGEGEIALVLSDITRLKNIEKMRKEFVANVSHELRTPITVLRGYLETLGDGLVSDNPAILKACNQMKGQVRRMQNLANDLIILSRLESKPDEGKRSQVDLYPLLTSIVDEASVVSDGRHQISMQCPEDLALMAQQNDLRSAISNLVINAVRHNPEGTSIEVKAIAADGAVLISVRDNGVGISKELIPRLTERFYRTDSSRNSNVGGSGLGLAIVKHAVNRIGGELEIKSKLGEGTEFICRFTGEAIPSRPLIGQEYS